MKIWIKKALNFLEHSLGSIPQELNELDWKESLSPNNEKLCRHLSAFANLPGGGFLAFGISDIDAKPIGIDKTNATEIIKKIGNLCRDGVSPLVIIDHEFINYKSVDIY